MKKVGAPMKLVGVPMKKVGAPMKKLGVPLAELVPDMQRYFDIHQTSEDTFEKVNRRELMLGAVTIAQIVYMIDQRWSFLVIELVLECLSI